MPGAGQMGATLVNLASGGQTRVSGVVEGVMSLVAFLALGAFIAWIPVGALAGILIVVGVRMIDRHSLHLLESPWTMLDFIVIVAVVAVAVGYSLIAASGVGIALAMFLFIREQLSSTVIRRKMDGGSRFSKRVRLRQDMELLEKQGQRRSSSSCRAACSSAPRTSCTRPLNRNSASASTSCSTCGACSRSMSRPCIC
jgi:SulP family sulfate permease